MELTDFVKKYNKRGKGTPWAGANGVYVVSPSCPARFWEGERCGKTKVPRNLKIGKASGEHGFATAEGKGRLPTYRTYWPNGVTVHAVLITPSYDKTVHVIRDEALKRETTLRRIFKSEGKTGFGANGSGQDNGTRHLGSEWIHVTPSEMMNYLIATGPLRHPSDKLYGCTPKYCEQVKMTDITKDVERLNSVVQKLEYVLNHERQEKKIGIPGRPVVLPRTIVAAAQDRQHPLHLYAHLLKSNVEAEKQLAERRIADKKQRDLLAIAAKENQARTRRERQIIRNAVRRARDRREPRNLAALRPTEDYALAELRKRRQTNPIPTRTPRAARTNPTQPTTPPHQ